MRRPEPIDRTRKQKTVLDEVSACRRHQVAKGYDAAHDDQHANGCIAAAAAAFASRAFWRRRPEPPYPWGDMPEGTPREDLIDAAALCIAEIERMDRVKLPNTRD